MKNIKDIREEEKNNQRKGQMQKSWKQVQES